jgi:hypothetical protein
MPIAPLRPRALLTALFLLQGCQSSAYLTLSPTLPLGPVNPLDPAAATSITTTPLTPNAAPPHVGGPIILGFSRMTVASGDMIVIQGANFDPAIAGNQVLIGGIPATIFQASPTSLTVMVPPGATQGTVSVMVIKSGAVAQSSAPIQISVPAGSGGGNGASNGSSSATLAITSLSRTWGSPGDTIVLSGGNFALSPSANQVTFGGVHATVVGATATNLTVVVPPGVASGPIAVTIPGTATCTSSTTFAVPTGVGTFAADGTVPFDQWLPGTALYQGSLYLLGGLGDTGTIASATQSVIQPNGSFGPFTNLPGVNLNTSRAGAISVVLGNHLYMIGGLHTGPTMYLSDTEVATFDALGNLGPFTPDLAASLPMPCYAGTSAVIGNRLYVIGGDQALNMPTTTIYQASFAADGTLGPFATSTVSLVQQRYLYTSAVVGNHLYVFGGDDGGAHSLSSIEVSPIASDGTLVGFSTATNVLNPTLEGESSVVVGNNLYLIGGWSRDGATFFPLPASKAIIQPDGTLGPFSSAPATTLLTGRWLHKSLLIGNNLYVLGGDTNAPGGGHPIQSIEVAPVQF